MEEAPDISILQGMTPEALLLDGFYTASGDWDSLEGWKTRVLNRDMDPERRLMYAVKRAEWTTHQQLRWLYPGTAMNMPEYDD